MGRIHKTEMVQVSRCPF